MNIDSNERSSLIAESTWRQAALPAGRIALVRGVLVFIILCFAYAGVVPLGPETGPGAELLASHWTPDPTANPGMTLMSALLSIFATVLPVEWAAKFLSITLTGAALALLVCWLRQLDASRSTVVPAALLAGLSPGICHLVNAGGDAPLLLFLGSMLLVATDQVRAEAGRGIFFVGVFCGSCLLIGPEMFPLLVYALLTILLDRGLRGLRSRGFTMWGVGSFMGAAIVVGICVLQLQPSNFDLNAAKQLFLSPWQKVISTIHLPKVEVLLESSQQLGLLFVIVALPGFLWGILRRPGDIALLLLIMSSGSFVAPDSGLFASVTLPPEKIDRFTLFSTLPALVFSSWTLTLLHRSMARFQPTKKILVTVSSLILCTLTVISVEPPLWKPNSNAVRQWSTAVLELAPKESLLLTGGGEKAAALEAVQWLYQIRPDVTILDPWGELLPSRIGLPEGTDASATRTGLLKLIRSDRPLVLLPEAMSHALVAESSFQPRGLLFEIRPQTSPLQSDLRYWDKLDLSHIPDDPQKAIQWLKGKGDLPPRRGRLAGRVATDTWLAMARSKQELTYGSRWSPILALLDELQKNPDEVREWFFTQGAGIPDSSPDPVPRTRD